MKALDLFAGTGWGVACKWLGIEEDGVELMPEAVATRTANGMNTIFSDVWEGLLMTKFEFREKYGEHILYIASPPCQTFSAAGNGAGRKALDEVITAIEEHLYKDPAALKDFGRKHDDRTALVLTPLAYVWRDMPEFVVLEQVPTVQPVWEAYAAVLRSLGYSVETAILNAEQYGVPQTRRRSILVASLVGEAKLPTPTHSRYYPRDPKKLDAGVLPWVSMAEALGWGRTVPSPTYCNSGHGGAGIEWGGNSVRKSMRAQSLSGENWKQKPGVEQGTNDAIRVTPDDAATLQSYPTGRGLVSRPSPTITGGGVETGGAEPIAKLARYTGSPDWQGETERLTTGEAATLQSYPSGWGFTDRPAVTVGNAVGRGLIGGSGAKDAVVRAMDSGVFIPSIHAKDDSYAEKTRITPKEAATLQSYPQMLRSNYGTSGDKDNRGERTIDQPAATLTSKASRNKWDGEKGMLPQEAAALQSYEAPFVWCGPKSKVYLQIGNAVPPVLAHAILSSLITPRPKPAAKRRRRTVI